MKDYECKKCGKIFDRKSNYYRHNNKKIQCNILFNNNNTNNVDDMNNIDNIDNIDNTDNIDNIDNVDNVDNVDNIDNIDNDIDNKFVATNCINTKTMKDHLAMCKCIYCGKQYSKKGNVIYHIKNNCKKVKEIENEKMNIFLKLKEIEIKRERDVLLEETGKKTDLKKRIKILECELKKTQNILIQNNSNSNSNNLVNNMQQNITLVGYQNENLEKIEKDEILAVMKKGFQATVELTRAIHFNSNHPEFHNIFIPKINEKYGMVFTSSKWKITDKNELVNDIYENKRDFIIQNLDYYYPLLDDNKKKSLTRWLNMDNINDKDESIKNTKNDIKMLLYNDRHLPMNRKKLIEKKQREDAKKLEIVSFCKKKKE